MLKLVMGMVRHKDEAEWSVGTTEQAAHRDFMNSAHY